MKLTFVFIALVAVNFFDEKFLVEAATSAEARKQILAHHNEMRNNVEEDIGVAASNMMKMNYDTSLEADAQAWADRCVREHSRNTGSGENLYWAWHITPREPNKDDLLSASEAWWKEKFNYIFAGDNSNHTVGHYTQQIWWRSDRLGCAASFCPELTHSKADARKNAIFVVCRYKDVGNMGGKPPFTEGYPKCNEFDPTYSNLCIPCREETTKCIDGGKWNMVTCKCDCPPDGTLFKHLSPDCKQQYDCDLLCSDDDSPYCSQWESYCKVKSYKKFMTKNCLYYCNCR